MSLTKHILVCAAIFLLFDTSNALAVVLAGPIANFNHQYYLLEDNTWTNSEAEAQSLGGHLVTIDSQAENDWVVSTFLEFGGVGRNLWIGLNDQASEGSMVWADGSALSYTNWAAGEPNDAGGTEDFVHYWGPGHTTITGKWNDITDVPPGGIGTFHGVVEVVPEPRSLALLICGVAAITLKVRRQDGPLRTCRA